MRQLLLTDILTIEDVSKLFKISKGKLYKDARDGKIPAKKMGKQWRFMKTDLINWFMTL